MKSFYQSILLGIWVFSLFFGLASTASAINCSAANAKWNRDYYTDPSGKTFISSPFQCIEHTASSVYDKNSPTIIKSGTGPDRAECPSGQRCLRTQDCNDIGGICFSGSVTMANMKYPDGEPRSKYPDYTASIPFRCPGDASISCFVQKVSSLASDPIITPEASPEPVVAEDPQPVRPFTNCCREIVPKDGNSYSEGKYGLNHFIQVGINVYECILCMVAALMLLMFVIGSFYLMTSAGSKPSVDKGIAIIKNAIIGAIIVFASILIVNYSVKALGGSFLDSQKLEINPSAGKQITSVASSPVPVVVPTAASPSTPDRGSVSLAFKDCTKDQQAKIKIAVGTAARHDIPGLGDASSYIQAQFAEIKCQPSSSINCGPGDLAYYSNNPSCPSEVNICPALFNKNTTMITAALIHEATHAVDCKGSKPADRCVAEQNAFSVQADYLDALGQRADAHFWRCEWWVGTNYKVTNDKDETRLCDKATDPKC